MDSGVHDDIQDYFCSNINFIEMSRRYSTHKNNSSFHGTLTNTNPTVISAIRQLKEESEMLLREHKRYKVLNHHISRENIRQINRSKQESFFSAVQQSARYDREVKKEYEKKKIEEVKKRFSVNQKEREKNKLMIENVKKSFRDVNHQVYENIRQKKKENEELIHSKRSFVLQSRVMSRKKAEEEEKTRRKSIQNFYESRVQTYRHSKEEEVKHILRRSEEKKRFAQALSSRNSRIRENKLKDSRSLSNSSIRNPEASAKAL